MMIPTHPKFWMACIMSLMMAAAFGQSPGDAQRTNDLVGMWQLVSWLGADGQPVWGQHPKGIIAYDASGHFSVQIMPDLHRPKYANPSNPTPEEAKVALTGYTAYFGTYSVDRLANTVTHHIQGSIRPSSVGVDYIRQYEWGADGSVTLIPVQGGGPKGSRLKWKRIQP
jgi:hypothetical protein